MMEFSSVITLDGYPCLHPDEATLPAAEGLATSFTLPLGPHPGRGWCLLARGTIKTIQNTGETLHTLKWIAGDRTLELKGLVIVRADRLTTGGAESATSVYLVELADKRWLMDRWSDFNECYNVRRAVVPYDGSDATRFYSESLNSGALWTWQTMLDNIWAELPSSAVPGTSPTLPFTPDGNPECWRFNGVPAWRAYNLVLRKIGCAIEYAPRTGNFSVVQLGQTQAGLSAIEGRAKQSLLFDAEPLTFAKTQVPKTIRVHFPRFQLADDKDFVGSPSYTVDKATGVAGVSDDTYLDLWDDLSAVYFPGGSLANSSALSTRATEVAANKTLDMRTARQRRVYGGIQEEFRVGSQVKLIQWRTFSQARGGTRTEVAQFPGVPAPLPDSTLPMLEKWDSGLNEHLGPLDVARRTIPKGWKAVGKAAADITAGTSTTPGSGTVRLWGDDAAAGPLADAGSNYDVTAYNLSTTAVTAGSWLQMSWDGLRWLIDFEDC